jgi:RND family efflux transporter MFP subunit
LRFILVVIVAAGLALAAGTYWSAPLRSLAGKIGRTGGAAHSQPATLAGPAGKQWYTCGMHPQVVLPQPGDCPICHMKLVPLDPAKFSPEVVISPVMEQNIGIRVAPVVTGPVTRVLRTFASVDYDEKLVRDVNLKIGGWVEKLHVDYVGMPVEKDQPLLEIYSPDLFSAQEEYLSALRSRRGDATRPTGSGGESAKWDRDLVESARKRLENFDISPGQIQELEQAGKASKTMTLRSPYRGLVIAKNVMEGQKVDPGMQLYRIADLSKVWVMATLYEYQIPFVELGQKAVITLPFIPGRTFEGKIGYIYPTLNPDTRQVKVRVEVDNSDGLLKPGMFANVELRSTLATDRILVPREAVVDTGERKIVFVSRGVGAGGGRFDPRPVQTDVEAENGMIVIRDGLKPGEMVVTSGEFLLDSEARLREALGKMVRGELASEQKMQAAVGGASELASLPDAASKQIVGLMDGYFAIGDKLAGDTVEGLADPARKVAAAVDALIRIDLPADPHFWQRHTEAADVRGKALEMIEAKDVVQARQIFADLSTGMEKLLKATGVPPSFGKEVDELHCPMYRQGQGGTWWLQQAGAIRNPYYGKVMIDCHDEQFALPVTGVAPAPSAAPAPASAPAAGLGGTTAMPAAMTMPAASTRPALSATAQGQVDQLVAAYLEVQKLLAGDKVEGVGEQLSLVAESAKAMTTEGPLKAAADRVVKAACEKATSIDEIRLAYKALSTAVIELVQLAPPSAKVAAVLYQIHCPMTKGDWLQTNPDVSNPYYGKAMPTCGSVTATIPAAMNPGR